MVFQQKTGPRSEVEFREFNVEPFKLEKGFFWERLDQNASFAIWAIHHGLPTPS